MNSSQQSQPIAMAITQLPQASPPIAEDHSTSLTSPNKPSSGTASGGPDPELLRQRQQDLLNHIHKQCSKNRFLNPEALLSFLQQPPSNNQPPPPSSSHSAKVEVEAAATATSDEPIAVAAAVAPSPPPPPPPPLSATAHFNKSSQTKRKPSGSRRSSQPDEHSLSLTKGQQTDNCNNNNNNNNNHVHGGNDIEAKDHPHFSKQPRKSKSFHTSSTSHSVAARTNEVTAKSSSSTALNNNNSRRRASEQQRQQQSKQRQRASFSQTETVSTAAAAIATEFAAKLTFSGTAVDSIADTTADFTVTASDDHPNNLSAADPSQSELGESDIDFNLSLVALPSLRLNPSQVSSYLEAQKEEQVEEGQDEDEEELEGQGKEALSTAVASNPAKLADYTPKSKSKSRSTLISSKAKSNSFSKKRPSTIANKDNSNSNSTPISKKESHSKSKSRSKSRPKKSSSGNRDPTSNSNSNSKANMPSLSISGVGFRRSSRRESHQTEGEASHPSVPGAPSSGRSRSRYSRRRVSPTGPPLTEDGPGDDEYPVKPAIVAVDTPGSASNLNSTVTAATATGGGGTGTATFNGYKFSDPACPFDANGCCVIHPDVRMAKWKGSRGWKMYLEECPKCFDIRDNPVDYDDDRGLAKGNDGAVGNASGGEQGSGGTGDTESMTSDPTQDSIHTRDYSSVHSESNHGNGNSKPRHPPPPPPSNANRPQPQRVGSNSSVNSHRSNALNNGHGNEDSRPRRRPRDHEADRKSLMDLRSSGNSSASGPLQAYDRLRQDSYRGRSPDEPAIDENGSQAGRRREGNRRGRVSHPVRRPPGDRTRSMSRRPSSRRSIEITHDRRQRDDRDEGNDNHYHHRDEEKPRDRSRPRERNPREHSRHNDRSASCHRTQRSERSPSRGPSSRRSSSRRGHGGDRPRRSRRVPKPKTPRAVCVDGVPFDSKGRCFLHPHIKLASKKMLGGWKIHLEFCPACAKEGQMLDNNESDYDDRSMVSEVSDATGFTQGSRGGGSVYSRGGGGGSVYSRGAGGSVYSRRSYRSDAGSVYSSRSNYSNASGVSWSSNQRHKSVNKKSIDDIPMGPEGYCLHHPEVQLAKLGKKGEWKILLDFCPECAEDSLMLGGAVGVPSTVGSSFRSNASSSRKESSFRSAKGESSSQDLTLVEKMPFVDEDGKAGHYTGHVNSDGKPTGKGKMKYVDGSKFSGIWEDGSKMDGRVTSAKKIAASSSSRRQHGPASAVPPPSRRSKSKARNSEVREEDHGRRRPSSRRDESIMSRGGPDHGTRRRSHRVVDDAMRRSRARSRSRAPPLSVVGDGF